MEKLSAEEAVMEVLGIVHEENGVFGISFPEFPGCVTGADTLEEAIRKAGEALTFHVAGMIEDGEAVPALQSLDDFDGEGTEQDFLRIEILINVPVLL